MQISKLCWLTISGTFQFSSCDFTILTLTKAQVLETWVVGPSFVNLVLKCPCSHKAILDTWTLIPLRDCSRVLILQAYGSPHCVSQRYAAVTNIWDNQLTRRKRLFWLTVLEASVRINWTLLLLNLWWCIMIRAHDVGLGEQKHLLHGQEAKERNRKGPESHHLLLRWTPSDMKTFYCAPIMVL